MTTMENKKNCDQVISILDDEEEDDDMNFATSATVVPMSLSSSKSYTIIEFLNDIWIPTYSAVKNLRLIVGFLSKSISTLNERSTDSSRVRERIELRSAIMDLLNDWTRHGPVGVSCSKETLQRFLAEYRSKKFDVNKIDPFLTRDIPKDKNLFDSLVIEYAAYLKSLFSRVRRCSFYKKAPIAVSRVNNNEDGNEDDDPEEQEQEEEEEEEEEEEQKEEEQDSNNKKKKEGFSTMSKGNIWKRQKRDEQREETDALFDCSIFNENERQRNDDRFNRLPQFMTKLESDGKLRTWRTPGEIGHSLIRIEVYNFKDIVKMDKRNWWKSARLRSQFLSQESCPSKLTELLNEMATEMSKISGLAMETRGVTM